MTGRDKVAKLALRVKLLEWVDKIGVVGIGKDPLKDSGMSGPEKLRVLVDALEWRVGNIE